MAASKKQSGFNIIAFLRAIGNLLNAIARVLSPRRSSTSYSRRRSYTTTRRHRY